jgi:hypothetical protein
MTVNMDSERNSYIFMGKTCLWCCSFRECVRKPTPNNF